jgi:hypothetical protein
MLAPGRRVDIIVASRSPIECERIVFEVGNVECVECLDTLLLSPAEKLIEHSPGVPTIVACVVSFRFCEALFCSVAELS